MAYNIYHAPAGCAETYLGRVDTLDEAYELEGASGLPEHLYETARAAGHCNGISAPDKSREAGEPTEWFGADDSYCAIAVLPATKHIDPDAYSVHDYQTGREMEGLPTEELVRESLSAGDTGAVCASYDRDQARWDYVSPEDRERAERRGETVRTVYVEESGDCDDADLPAERDAAPGESLTTQIDESGGEVSS